MQLTTAVTSGLVGGVLFINYVNVLFRGIGRVRNRLNNLRPVGRGLDLTIVNLSYFTFFYFIKTTGDFVPRPLSSFHNGIILIVNCLKSFTKLQLFFHSAKFILYLADTLLLSTTVYCCFSIIPKSSFGVLGGF